MILLLAISVGLCIVAAAIPTASRRRVSPLSEEDRLAWVERDRAAYIAKGFGRWRD